ncbi:MAG: tetratricopeptide repeat protein, partial [Stackebrandtia sp.]
VADAEIPDGRQARSAALRTALAGRRVLVVLDNAVDAGQVRPLLPGEPECLAIVTSRRRLVDLVDAHPMSLEVLTPADAAALFADAAATSSRPIAPDRAVAEIVEACGRLPLAVRIAASRLRNRPAWTPADLLSRLSRTDRTLEALNADSRGVAAAFSLSYDELDAEHRRLFGLLAAGPGPEFDAEAAATLADRPLHAAEKMVENLVDGHLLMTDAPGRYHFHDLLRQYAVTVADQVDAQARADALTRLLNAYAVTTRAAVGLLDPHLTAWPRLVEPGHVAGWSVDDRPQAVSWFAAEQANLTLAVEECLERQLDGYAAELCAALSCYLEFHGHGEDRVAVERNGLAAARRMRRVDLEAYFSNRLGLSQLRLGRFSEAIDWLEAALRLWSDVGDPRGTAATLNNLGNLHASRGDYLASIDAYERVVETATSAGLKELEAQGRYNLSWPLLWLDRLDEARACLDGASAAFRELGHEREEARVLFHLGLVAWRGGDFAEALRLHERVLAQCRDYGEPDGTAWSHAVIADDLRGLGRGAEALDHCQLALDTLDGLNQPALEARILHRLGAVQQTLDDRDSALESHHAAAGIAARLGARHLLAEAERGVAEALRAAGDESGARRYLERALDYFAAAGLSEADEVRRELAVDDR